MTGTHRVDFKSIFDFSNITDFLVITDLERIFLVFTVFRHF
jgi:hypothetical protein